MARILGEREQIYLELPKATCDFLRAAWAIFRTSVLGSVSKHLQFEIRNFR